MPSSPARDRSPPTTCAIAAAQPTATAGTVPVAELARERTTRATSRPTAPTPATVAPVEGYQGLNRYITDLVRAVQAELAYLASGRQDINGRIDIFMEGHERVVVNDLSPEEIARLAAGQAITVGGRSWTVATLATGASLSTACWGQLSAATAAVRLARSQASAPEHPAQRLLAHERLLGEPMGFIARLMAVSLRPASSALQPVLERFGLELPMRIEEALLLIEPSPDRWLDAVLALNPEHPLFNGGAVCDWGRGGPDDIQICNRQLVASTSFAATCVGRMLPLPELPGVTVTTPRVPLEHVVMPPALRAQVDQLVLDPPRTGPALGILIYGPSGTGKTMLANALASRVGRRLVLIDAASILRPDTETQDTAGLIGLALRRCAVNGDILCIDEAHQIVTQPDVLRLLLTALEQTPAVVILATTKPELLDSALDRRLPIRLVTAMPDAAERLAILRQELAEQQIATSATPAELADIAARFRIAGGWWRTVVRQAAMAARVTPTSGAVAAHDLRSQARLARHVSMRASWPEGMTGLASDSQAVAPERDEAMGHLVQALQPADGPVRGGLIQARGPDIALVETLAMRLADMLGRSAARIDGFGQESGPMEERDLCGPLFGISEPIVVVWSCDRMSPSILRHLVRSTIRRRHVIILATMTPDVVIDREAVLTTLDWGIPMPSEVAVAWTAAGGVGPAPRCQTLAGVHAALVRLRLGNRTSQTHLP